MMTFDQAVRALERHGLTVVPCSPRVMLPAERPGGWRESAEMAAYRLRFRAQLEAERSAAAARSQQPARLDPGDFAPFPADPWPNSRVFISKPLDRPARVLGAGDFAPIPEPIWSRDEPRPAAAARRDHRAAAVDDGPFVPCPPSPWGD